MKNYKFTKKGKVTLGAMGVLALATLALGGIYWASYVFIVCLLGFSISFYEFFINK
jgi:hypothetical protein